jgi:hypothetical protein
MVAGLLGSQWGIESEARAAVTSERCREVI